ncbi:entericidin A/B family lipoprotein [uncultured Maricaulis sp.]|nr:entericidin A/B family lipoprotein [uncultured Maricaulis sp.]
MKKIITLTAMTLFAISLAGCNTLRGAGQDIERAGEAVQDASS